MKDQREQLPLLMTGKQHVSEDELRSKVIFAVQRNWDRMTAYAKSRFEQAVDPADVLDSVVESAVRAERKGKVRRLDAFVFCIFAKKARQWLLRQRIEYHDPEELAQLRGNSDSSFVRQIEINLQLRELQELLDNERERTICAMFLQGYTYRQTGEVLGMTEDAVRKCFDRAVEKLKRIVSKNPTQGPRSGPHKRI